MYLKRYHDVEISKSGVWRILKRLNLSRLPASQRYKRHDKRWKRYEKQRPGHHMQIDVKFIEPIAGVTGRRGGRNKYHQFTAIDDCTRPRVLRTYPQLNQKTAIQFVDYVCSACRSPSRRSRPTFKLGVALKVRGSSGRWCEDLGVRHPLVVVARPSGARRARRMGGLLTTTIACTAASAARHRTNASSRRPRPRRKRSSSVAQSSITRRTV